MIIIEYTYKSFTSSDHFKFRLETFRTCKLPVIPLSFNELDHAYSMSMTHCSQYDSQSSCCFALTLSSVHNNNPFLRGGSLQSNYLFSNSYKSAASSPIQNLLQNKE